MTRAETPAFSYLQAELGARGSDFQGINLPEITRDVFMNAFNAHQEVLQELSRAEADLANYQIGLGSRLPNFGRIIAFERQIRNTANLLLALREGYVPAPIPDDEYVGVIPEKMGIRNFIDADVRRVATQTLRLQLQSSLRRKASEAVIKARKTNLFGSSCSIVPRPIYVRKEAVPAPGSRVFGIVHTEGDLTVTQWLDRKGARILGGIPLEIVRI